MRTDLTPEALGKLTAHNGNQGTREPAGSNCRRVSEQLLRTVPCRMVLLGGRIER